MSSAVFAALMMSRVSSVEVTYLVVAGVAVVETSAVVAQADLERDR